MDDISMMFMNYSDRVGEAIQYLVALGSVMGFLGLLFGFFGFFFQSGKHRNKYFSLIAVSFALIAICGLHTGTKYFRLY